MVDAGWFTERIRFERYDDDADAWVPFAVDPEWAASITALGDEQYRISIRYRPDLVGFKDAGPAVRIVWPASPDRPSDRVWDVKDVVEVERRQRLDITAHGRQIESVNLGSGARRSRPWPR